MRKLSALVTVVALGVAGCGDSSGDTTTTEAPSETTFAVTTTEPTPTTTAPPTADPIATVEALFDAWNRGDIDTYIALQSDEAIEIRGNTIFFRAGTGLSYEQAERAVRDDFMFWYLTGTEWTLSDCEASPELTTPGDVVSCLLIANTGFLRALGEADSGRGVPIRYVVEDGTITFGTVELVEEVPNALAQASFIEWAEERIEDGTIEEGTVPCDTLRFIYTPPLGHMYPPTPVCAQWIGDHLDEWKADLDSEHSSQP